MRLLQKTFDGGPDSTVTAYVLIEIKSLFSIKLLKFHNGSRENYHSHAFNALTWFLKGRMIEHNYDGTATPYKRSLIPKLTRRHDIHKVVAEKTSWCFTLRGPWHKSWNEFTSDRGKKIILTNGRKILNIEDV